VRRGGSAAPADSKNDGKDLWTHAPSLELRASCLSPVRGERAISSPIAEPQPGGSRAEGSSEHADRMWLPRFVETPRSAALSRFRQDADNLTWVVKGLEAKVVRLLEIAELLLPNVKVAVKEATREHVVPLFHHAVSRATYMAHAAADAATEKCRAGRHSPRSALLTPLSDDKWDEGASLRQCEPRTPVVNHGRDSAKGARFSAFSPVPPRFAGPRVQLAPPTPVRGRRRQPVSAPARLETRVRLPRLAPFHGRPMEDVAAWSAGIEKAFRNYAQPLTQGEKLAAVVASLRGEAAEYFFKEARMLCSDYGSLVLILMQHFSLSAVPDLADKGAFSRRPDRARQGRFEAVEAYSLRALRECHARDPRMSTMNKVCYFQAGLRPGLFQFVESIPWPRRLHMPYEDVVRMTANEERIRARESGTDLSLEDTGFMDLPPRRSLGVGCGSGAKAPSGITATSAACGRGGCGRVQGASDPACWGPPVGTAARTISSPAPSRVSVSSTRATAGFDQSGTEVKEREMRYPNRVALICTYCQEVGHGPEECITRLAGYDPWKEPLPTSPSPTPARKTKQDRRQWAVNAARAVPYEKRSESDTSSDEVSENEHQTQ
jgi:hypothetical protein